MASTFLCGCECGIFDPNLTAHWLIDSGTPTFSTTTFRSGLRSLRCNPSASVHRLRSAYATGTADIVGRIYIRFATLPNVDVALIASNETFSNNHPTVYYKQSDSKIYAAVGANLGASGFTVTTDIWYRVDFAFHYAASDTCDVSVDGTALGQASFNGPGTNVVAVYFGAFGATNTSDVFFDDYLASATAGDYPLGPGYVLSYIPNADGTHNVAGAADFKHGTGTTPAGADITNATTTAWQNIDKRPLVTSAAGAETLINMIAPPNATDYVEIQFEDSVEATAPRALEVIIGINQAGTGAGNMEVRLNDNGTMGTVYTATGVAGVAIATGVVFKRAYFVDPPSAASAWVLGGAGDGDFNNLRIRFGSPAAVDANPDQYLVEVMFEAEYAEVFSATRKPVIINQARARAAVR